VYYQWIEWTSPEAIIIACATCLCIFLNVVAIGLTKFTSNISVIARSSPLFLYIILGGTLISYSSVFFMIGEPTSIRCICQVWLVFIGFVVSFAALVAKNWRMWRLYYGSIQRNIVLTDYDILRYLGIIWGVMIVILLLWTVLFPPQPTIVGDEMMCSGSPMMFYVACAYVVVMAIFGVVMAVRTRSLPQEFREAKWIGLGSYNLAILTSLTVPVAFTIRNTYATTAFVILSVGIILWTNGIWMFLLFSKFYLIFVKGEKAISIRQSTRQTSRTPNDRGSRNSAERTEIDTMGITD